MPRKRLTAEDYELQNRSSKKEGRQVPFWPSNVHGTLSENKQKMYDRAKRKLRLGEGALTIGQTNALSYASTQKEKVSK